MWNRKRLSVVLLAGILTSGLVACTRISDAPQARYEPNWESIGQHQASEWFQDAKLGIFIHWGLYSVPGWATPTGELGKVDRNVWFKNNPYAEWYLNTVKIESLSAREGSTVQMLGATGDLDWTQEGENLSVTLPTELPGDTPTR